jgi:hypothetical protein
MIWQCISMYFLCNKQTNYTKTTAQLSAQLTSISVATVSLSTYKQTFNTILEKIQLFKAAYAFLNTEYELRDTDMNN